jgi:hypothetical protein
MIADPTPDIGCDQFGDHEHCHQFTDIDRSEIPPLQVEPPERHQGAKGCEVEKVETG